MPRDKTGLTHFVLLLNFPVPLALNASHKSDPNDSCYVHINHPFLWTCVNMFWWTSNHFPLKSVTRFSNFPRFSHSKHGELPVFFSHGISQTVCGIPGIFAGREVGEPRGEVSQGPLDAQGTAWDFSRDFRAVNRSDKIPLDLVKPMGGSSFDQWGYPKW